MNSIDISDFRYKSFLTYFSKVYVPSFRINGLCTTQTFDSIVTYPSRLKSFTLKPEGIACATFISDALKHSSNLVTLNLSGKMKGLLTPFEDKLHFPKLSSLTLNSNNCHLHPLHNLDSHIQSFVDVLHGRSFDVSTVLAFWQNQTILLKLLSAPNLEQATLYLHTFTNAPAWEEISEEELMAQVLHFLGRHKKLKKLHLHHGERSIESRLFEYRTQTPRPPTISISEDHRLTPADLMTPSPHKMAHFLPGEIQHFEFCSSLPPQFEDDLHGLSPHQNAARLQRNLPPSSFEHYVLSLLKLMKCLTHLKFSGTKGRSLAWSHFAQIIASSSESLVHVEIVGKLVGPINFDVFSGTENLRVLMINNRQRHRSSSPVIENFFALTSNPHLADSLETLVLQNVGIKRSDFSALHQLRRLGHLAIYRWRCAASRVGEENLTPEGIKAALTLPSIKSLLLPWPKVIIVANLGAAVDHLAELEERFGFGTKCFLHPRDGRKMGVAQYVCIEEEVKDGDGGTKPLWRRTEWGFKIGDGFFS